MEDNIVPVIAILSIFVILPWLALHYRDRKRQLESQRQLNNMPADTNELSALAERMEQRIESLEKILDAEAPGWRQKHEHS
ncbi:MAG: envelope stress response membrane protein PspB [Stenotrophobium sp.]